MKHSTLLSWLLASVILSAGLGFVQAQQTQSGPASQPATTTSAATQAVVDTAVEQAAELGRHAVGEALAGRFQEALADLQSAGKLDPRDRQIKAAADLLKGYLGRLKQAHGERDTELALAVQRVRRSLLAQSYVEKLRQDGTDRKLRKEIREVGLAFHRAGAKALEQASDEQAAQVKSEALKAIEESAAALNRAVDLIGGHNGEYVDAFRGIAGKLARSFERYQRTWERIDVAGAKARRAGARKLADLEEGLNDALADLEAIAAEKPWRVGVSQAATAREIAPDKQALRKEDWYGKLLETVEAVAAKAVQDADWQEALGAYASLQALDPDNESYKEMVRTVRRSVRALSLYGRETLAAKSTPDELDMIADVPDQPAPQPATDRAEDSPAQAGEERWQELVDGVDVELVRIAIDKLHRNYVSPVDYRKLARGALLSVRVLAETPQVSKTFAGLADQSKREAFLKELEALQQSADSEDRFDETDLELVLNSVVRACERTVRIPTAVISLEFADGFLDELDKFSSMVWPHDEEDFNKLMKGRYFGVGIQIAKEPGQPLKVVTPLLDTPAYRIGIKTGDLILAVDGRNTEDLELEKLLRMIMGPKGTKVTLRIKSPGVPEPRDVDIVRDEIQIRTVKGWVRKPEGGWEYMIDPQAGIGYLRITQFTETTHEDAVRALDEMRQAGMRSLVLDMRFNPGGLLGEAAKMADEFLRGGAIVSTSGWHVRRSEITAHAFGKFLTGDLVVLVNEASASAAEIVAGALQDWQRALVVGQRTYGKGSVQRVIDIDRHSASLKLTTAYYYLPKGRLLHKENNDEDWGVGPDVAVPLTPKQIRRWQTIRSETDLIQNLSAEELQKNMQEQYEADLQLQTAVLLLKLKAMRE